MAQSVGVVVISGNREPRFVLDLMRTLAAQTRLPDAMALVNFGAPCAEFESASAPFRYIYRHLPQSLPWCLPIARNQGARLLPPVESVLFLDSDVLLAPDFIERGLRRLRHGVLLNCRMLDLPEHAITPETDVVRDFARLKRLAIPRREITAVGACQWVRAKAFEALRGHDEGFRMWCFDDMDFQRRARWLGLKSVHLDQETAMLHQWHRSKDDVIERSDGPESQAARHWFEENGKRIRHRAALWDLCKYDPLEINPDGWGKLVVSASGATN